MVRAFICIDVPSAIKDSIGELQRKLKGVGGQVSWVKPANIHLTLKFLGAVPESQIDSISEACRKSASNIGQLEIEIGGVGCFPSTRSPRVLWVGLCEVPEGLSRLYSNIENNLTRLGFKKEARKFGPHLTIGRLRSQDNASRLAQELAANGFSSESFIADEMILMESKLNPAGAIYTPLATFRL